MPTVQYVISWMSLISEMCFYFWLSEVLCNNMNNVQLPCHSHAMCMYGSGSCFVGVFPVYMSVIMCVCVFVDNSNYSKTADFTSNRFLVFQAKMLIFGTYMG